MTWKERRTITILSVILAILSAALVIVLAMKYRESRNNTTDPAAHQSGQISSDAVYSTLTYYNGSATLSFSHDEEGAWIWDGDPDFPLDDTTLTSILTTLSSLTPQQVLSDPEAPENYGLDDPAATFTAEGKDGTLSLTFGKSTTDGKSRYTMINGDPSTLYIFPGTLLEYLKIPIYDMMTLPELPELTPKNLLTISIQGPSAQEQEGVLTVLSALRENNAGEATWRYDGANITDDPVLAALLQDLSDLTVKRCVDYRPSKEAVSICGFDHPAASVTITYHTQGGAGQTFSMNVGIQTPDQSGRYVRIGADSTIYLIETELLDPLMRVAANGLEP